MSVTTALLATSAMSTLSTAYTSAQATKSAGEYQQQIAESNSRLANIQAQDAIVRGEAEAKKAKEAAKRLIGSQRAALAAQGLSLEEDDALFIQQDTAELGALDAWDIKNNAWREAWGYRVEANRYTTQGQFAKITSTAKARNTLLTGGLQATRDIAYGVYLNENKKNIYESGIYDTTK